MCIYNNNNNNVALSAELRSQTSSPYLQFILDTVLLQ